MGKLVNEKFYVEERENDGEIMEKYIQQYICDFKHSISPIKKRKKNSESFFSSIILSVTFTIIAQLIDLMRNNCF